MTCSPGLDVAGHHRLGLCIDAQLTGVAIIVNVIGPVGSKEPGIGSRAGIALRFVVAAICINHVVLNERMAEASRGKCQPVARQIVVQPRAGIECVVRVGRTPRLIAKHCRRINFVDVRQRRTAQQLIPAPVAFSFMLVLEVALQNRLGAQLPIGRARAHSAPAVGVAHIACDSFAGQIHARAHLFAAAEQPPQIHSSIRAAAMIGRQIESLDSRRPLGHVVDQTARTGHAALHARNPLENLHALLVLERNVLLACDGHPVDLEAGCQVDRETANLIDAVVAHRNVIVAHRRVVLHHIGKQARNLVVQQIACHHHCRQRRLRQRCAIQRANCHRVRKVVVPGLAMHHYRRGDRSNLLRRRLRGVCLR